MKDLVKVNIFNACLLIGVVLLKLVWSTQMFIVFLVVWLVFAVWSNYNILIKENDLLGLLRSANKHRYFNHQVSTLSDCYNAIEQKREYFETYPEDNSIRKSYVLLSKQITANIRAATNYMSGYDYVTKSSYNYLDRICNQSCDLVQKLHELSDLVAQVDDSASNVDITYVDDFIKSLRSVQDYEE